MILHPAIIALLISSILASAMMLYAAYWGLRILRNWDLSSGSELQLDLERRTYLLSTVLTYVFAFHLFSLFLYIYTAESLHDLFVGAMCAAGTLNVNQYGYPLLITKIFNFLLVGSWLILNCADTRAYDYPLIRKKYVLLLIIAPALIGEAFLQIFYFLGLKADVITSCCGSLFSTGRGTVTSDVSGFPPFPMMVAFFISIGLTLASGLWYYRRGRAGIIFSSLSFLTFLISFGSLISVVSLYIYELPTHHCPFCVLQREYHYVGYLLYLTLLGGGVTGLGVGILIPFRKIQSLTKTLPLLQKRLALISIVSYAILAGTVSWKIFFSALNLS